jgi:hypothetical protein
MKNLPRELDLDRQILFSVRCHRKSPGKMDLSQHLTTAVISTCVWVGVDNAWEQEKPEARKMLVNRAESHTSGARFVGWRFVVQDSLFFIFETCYEK